MGHSTSDRVPRHLRTHVLEQAYDRYDEIDQGVWRLVLRQLHGRLLRTAHPAYAGGLAVTGISTEVIPKIAEIDARLSDIGWGAVCVQGFLPPRAFQEFQAAGILPINAPIRSPEHAAYTPAPDIIHEAAGHAPILADRGYAAYLRRIGEVAAKAFTSPADTEVHRAIHHLSALK
jgi:phenylalanine-4-hydroxylase